MNGILKKYAGIMIAVVVIGAGIILFLRNDIGAKNNSAFDNLYSEKTISHGHGLAVDAQDSNKLYIATHYGLLVLINEKELYRIGKSRDDLMGFSVHPVDSGVFFSSGHPSYGGNIGFQKSDDGGITWKKISNGVNGPVDFHALAVSPVNPDIMYGWYQGNIQRSLDQGKTWEIINNNILAIQLAADSKDENIVYAATPNGVMISKDKGTAWGLLSLKFEGGAVFAIAVHPQDAKTLLVFSERLGGLGKSVDGGVTWKKISEVFNGEIIFHIAFSRINSNIVYVLTGENAIYKSADAGDTWQKITVHEK